MLMYSMLMVFGLAQLAAGSCCGGKASKPLEALAEMTSEESNSAPASAIVEKTEELKELQTYFKAMFAENDFHNAAKSNEQDRAKTKELVKIRDALKTTLWTKYNSYYAAKTDCNGLSKDTYECIREIRNQFDKIAGERLSELASDVKVGVNTDLVEEVRVLILRHKPSANYLLRYKQSAKKTSCLQQIGSTLDSPGMACTVFGSAPSLAAYGLGWNSYWAMGFAALLGAFLVFIRMWVAWFCGICNPKRRQRFLC